MAPIPLGNTEKWLCRAHIRRFAGQSTLTAEEFAALRSQFATSNAGGRGGRRYLPRVFTEHGALMAVTILNSPRAVEISVYVVRAFVRLSELALNGPRLGPAAR
jgi:hypothetical protein